MSDRPIIIETEKRSSGAGWVIAIVLVLALAIGLYFFSQTSSSEVARDNAVASAAGNVGEAAQDIGTAVGSAAENVTPDSADD